MRSIETIFNMNERIFPTSFVILEKEPFSFGRETDKLKAFQKVFRKLRDLYGALSDPVAAIESCLQKSIVLMLVCEVCGSPMPPGYTITSPKMVVGKWLPLARAGIDTTHQSI
jgi:ribosomal protein L44E